MDDSNQKQNKKFSKGINWLYKLTHYNSYHAYRQHLKIIRGTLWLALVLLIFRAGISGVSGFVINNLIVFLMGIYLIGTYMVTAKASTMFKDSAQVMHSIAFEGVVSAAWNIYDGVYGDESQGESSIEIIFFREKAFLTSLFNIVRKNNVTLPLSETDILTLRDYVAVLSAYQDEGKTFKVYTTVSDEMANQLRKYGIQLTQISAAYKDKPFRWDYARTTGKIKNAFFGYPNTWNAYLLSYTFPEDKKFKNVQNKKKHYKKAKTRYFN